jgi:hypothetical protein
MMAIWNPAPVAQWITERKRSKLFWNVFWSVVLAMFISYMFFVTYLVSTENFISYQEETFVEYQKDYLITDQACYDLRGPEGQEVRISKRIIIVSPGDKLTLGISKLSGELIVVQYQGELVYEIVKSPVVSTLVLCYSLAIPMIGASIFLLYVVNVKNPSKRIDKIKSQFVT